MDQAITVLQKNKRVTESIKNTSAGLPIDCSPDEQYEQTSKMLSNQYSISLTVSEIAKLNMNNLFEDVTLSLNSKELQNDSDLPEALTPLQAQKNTINMVMRP
ncbi:MAG: hypothetical protein HAW67_02270 [Endozoicomonadaceae bacterium]|nr:hypothetical protein [Endozoicomonadaceae bacterium]